MTLTVLWYIAYPFWILLQWLYYLLKPLRYLLYIFSVPFIHMVHFLGKALCWPVVFLAKLEVRNTNVLVELHGVEKAYHFEKNQMITSLELCMIPLNIRF